jgi:hypothetical protein
VHVRFVLQHPRLARIELDQAFPQLCEQLRPQRSSRRWRNNHEQTIRAIDGFPAIGRLVSVLDASVADDPLA